jgi:hypothetical protein
VARIALSHGAIRGISFSAAALLKTAEKRVASGFVQGLGLQAQGVTGHKTLGQNLKQAAGGSRTSRTDSLSQPAAPGRTAPKKGR